MSKEKQHGQLASVIKCKGTDDFKGYLNAKSALESAQVHLADLLHECNIQIQSSHDLLALKRCLKTHNIAHTVIEAVVKFHVDSGIDEQSDESEDIPRVPNYC